MRVRVRKRTETQTRLLQFSAAHFLRISMAIVDEFFTWFSWSLADIRFSYCFFVIIVFMHDVGKFLFSFSFHRSVRQRLMWALDVRYEPFSAIHRCTSKHCISHGLVLTDKQIDLWTKNNRTEENRKLQNKNIDLGQLTTFTKSWNEMVPIAFDSFNLIAR